MRACRQRRRDAFGPAGQSGRLAGAVSQKWWNRCSRFAAATFREGADLPTDQNQQPPQNAPGEASGEAQQPGQGQPAGQLNGLPRLFFPEQPGGGRPEPAPGAPGQAGQGWADPAEGQPGGAYVPGESRPQETPPAGFTPGWPAGNETGRPGQPPGQPGRPAGPARPGRPPEAAHRQRALAALILGLVSVLSFFGVGTNFRRGIYLLIFALAVGVAAIWLGVTASRRARREGTMRPRGALAGTVFGSIGLVLAVILLSMLAAFWSQFNAYSRCLETAQTPSAQQACYNQLTRSVNKVVSDLSTGGGS